MSLRVHILDTGYCLASEHHVMRGGRRRTMACHALVALLYHPRQGWLLWDTGYAPQMLTATRRWPFRLYRWFTPLALDPAEAVVAQIARFGLRAHTSPPSGSRTFMPIMSPGCAIFQQRAWWQAKLAMWPWPR
ncbi:hypothetical protein HC891_17405 [Candidatus Gracilibacteria bacterium]|nr:hypothetical protein [Candidatus Gracilibacteria bacterium]